MSSLPKAIGGYFELELPTSEGHIYSNALKFQSARAAFYALLNAGKPNRVWMPKYICDSMLSPLHAAGIEIKFYDLTEQLGVSDAVALAAHDWLLYVNYFGVCTEQETILLKRFKPSQLVFDHAQAFYTPPQNCLATIYSPRKYFGVPDGGFLVTKLEITEPNELDKKSITRCMHLLQRLDCGAEPGYASFKKAEKSLKDIQPRKMSMLTNRLLVSIDYESIKNKRNANFRLMHQKLKKINGLKLDVCSIDGPMCYPLLFDDAAARQRLIANRIFVATYWPEVRERVNADSLECRLVEGCFPLPCDQRYAEAEMKRIVKCLTKTSERSEK